ncbi:MAG: hypothetical protein JXJ04_05315 [Spirochaetales bacterium]|nr:hypothetical protein [Spirochaetales bacterium]
MITKKVFSLLFIILMGITGISTLYGVDCGDVNGDENIDIVDALLISRYYVSLVTSLPYPEVADVNNDTEIDILDALKIAQFYVGLIDVLECSGDPTPNPTQITGTIEISHMSGIQCEMTFYESMEDARNFLEANGITVLGMREEHYPVIAMCGAASGTDYIALIYISDLEKAIELGW